jgi:prephenate dehydrogenase
MKMGFDRIGIWGVGLIGGSLGLAVKRALPHVQILGVGRDPKRLDLARKMGAIDDFEPMGGPGLRSCDLVVLATPVEHILEILESIGKDLSPNTLVTDAGSTKRTICQLAWAKLPDSVEFVGGHPVAGREVTGVENSLPDLFSGAPWVLCRRPQASQGNLDRLRAFVERLGARPVTMTPEDHDKSIAWVSHLPQLLSTALANTTDGKGTAIAGSGLRDMLRLAGSSYSVWRGILNTNADNVDSALAEYIEHLEAVRRELKKGSLSVEFDRAVESYCRVRR